MEPINYGLSSDTICAVSTPAGRGGIAVIRVSGPEAVAIVDKIWKGKRLGEVASHTAHLGTVVDTEQHPLDQAVTTVFLGPRSYTGENIVEISVHGSIYVQQQLLASLVNAGARMAAPGEFTRRAFTNGRLDLAEAEAVADIISSSSRAAHSLAISQLQGRFSAHIETLRNKLVDLAALLELELDFSEEDVTFADRCQLQKLASEIKGTVDTLAATFASGQALRDGIPVAIVGHPNVGKSRLLNALLNSDRAIVSDIPGTTRDTVEDTTDIQNITFRFIDTAGIRHTGDPVENLGISRAISKIRSARITIWLLSPDELKNREELHRFYNKITAAVAPDATLLAVINKIDTLTPIERKYIDSQFSTFKGTFGDTPCFISALTEENLPMLKEKLVEIATHDLPSDESLIVTNARHHEALIAASAALRTLLAALPRPIGAISTSIVDDATLPKNLITPPTDIASPNIPYDYTPEIPLTTDLMALHLREAIDALSSITGSITSQEIINTIFTRFCIGK